MTSFLLCFSWILLAQKHDRYMEKLIRENFMLAAQQYKLLAKNTPADVMPRNYIAREGKLVTSNTTWWTSGFFTRVLYGTSMSLPKTVPSGQKQKEDLPLLSM